MSLRERVENLCYALRGVSGFCYKYEGGCVQFLTEMETKFSHPPLVLNGCSLTCISTAWVTSW